MLQSLKCKLASCARKCAKQLAYIGGFFYAVAIISLILKSELVSTIMALIAPIFLNARNIADFLVPPDKPIGNMTREERLELICSSNPQNDWESLRGNNESIVFYKKDSRFRFCNKDGEEGTLNKRFIAPWANCFLDPNASSYRYDLYYDGIFIKRFILVFVDGGRCFLPLPEDYASLKVSRINHHIAYIINASMGRVDGLSSYTNYFMRAGLKLEK